MTNSYDVIVIGSGAGGGTLVHQLAPSGKRILLLERGGWLRARAAELARPGCVRRRPLRLADTWHYPDGSAFQPQVHYFVGGATKLYGAALYRLRAEDFGELRHHDGISPAWPIAYEEMEPYYTKAEQLYQVHGARGEDPTEPPASAPYPFPAVSHEPRIQQLSDDLAKAGLPPVPRPVRDPARRGQHALQQVCPVRRIATAFRASCTPNRTPRCIVASGRRSSTRTSRCSPAPRRSGSRRTPPAPTVTERRGQRTTDRPRHSTADIVVVSCGAANSAKLLLASANDAHPHGLANGSDQVGRNYMFHNSQAVLALSKEENPTVFQKTLGVNDFYFAGGEEFDFPLGNIQMVGKSQAPMFRGEKPGETQVRSELVARGSGPARGRLLALHRGSARRREPRHAGRRRQRPRSSYKASNDEAEGAPVPPAQVDARGSRDASRSPAPASRVPEERDPGRRVRASGGDRAGSAPTPTARS